MRIIPRHVRPSICAVSVMRSPPSSARSKESPNERDTPCLNLNDHTIAEGWATYRCTSPNHEHIVAVRPSPANGHEPVQLRAMCLRGARSFGSSFGQHRYGSLSDPESGEPQ